MPHFTVNGVTVPGAADSFEVVPEYVGGETGRGVSGAYLETQVARKDRYTCKTVYTQPDVGEAWRKWVDGDGHSWSFLDNVYSGKGLGPKSGGSYTQAATGGKHAGRITVASGDVFQVALARKMNIEDGWDPTMGWTLMCWKKLSVGDGGDGSTYHHLLATGAVAVTRGGSANPPGVAQYLDGVAGSESMGNWISLESDGDVGIHGYDDAGVAAAYDYSGLVVLPFAVPAAWVPSIYTFHDANEWPRLKQLTLDGDAFEDGPVTGYGRATKVAQRGVFLGGAFKNNARILDLSFEQK